MTKSDLLKLGDFGISRVIESESKLADSVSMLVLQISCISISHYHCSIKRLPLEKIREPNQCTCQIHSVSFYFPWFSLFELYDKLTRVIS